MIVERVGETALRIRFDEGSLEEASRAADGLLHALGAEPLDEVAERWRGARSVMISLRGDPSPQLEQLIREPSSRRKRYIVGGQHSLYVRYDGPDLADVAERVGMSVDAVIELHASATYHLAFVGFAPGFPYLLGTPEPLARIPRRDTPRTHVPAGSLAIAGGWTGIYPNAGPGGWHVIGTVEATLFDPERARPSLFGDHVNEIRFAPR